MTAHPNKAEFLVWVEDPEYWVWQRRYVNPGNWIVTPPPDRDDDGFFRLVPRPWLEDPESWSVMCRPKNSDSWFNMACADRWGESAEVIGLSDPSEWDHDEWEFRLRPCKRTVYQKRVQVPEPYRGEMEEGQEYCVPAPEQYAGFLRFSWREREALCRHHHARGFIYLTPEDAAARGKAMGEIE